MKLGVVTICDASGNYGNKLQHYAVNKVLHSLSNDITSYAVEPFCINLKLEFKSFIQKCFLYKLPGNSFFWKYGIQRLYRFADFEKKYINTVHISSIREIPVPNTDFFVLGSDQVWNPSWYDDMKKESFLLTFVPSEKRVCFSPSFGIEKLPQEWIPWFKEHLSQFRDISVREDAGAEIVKELTGKNATVLIDPTLMLDAEEWSKISKKPDGVDFGKKYILTYFLGAIPYAARKIIDEIKDEYIVYNLMDESQPNIYVSGPAEFVYLIEHASLVLTDSFHACVFSFLFSKPFLVFKREGKLKNMMSRLETLTKKFHVERKIYGNSLNNDLFESDYRDGFNVLQKERKLVIDFLKRSMNLR